MEMPCICICGDVVELNDMRNPPPGSLIDQVICTACHDAEEDALGDEFGDDHPADGES